MMATQSMATKKMLVRAKASIFPRRPGFCLDCLQTAVNRSLMRDVLVVFGHRDSEGLSDPRGSVHATSDV